MVVRFKKHKIFIKTMMECIDIHEQKDTQLHEITIRIHNGRPRHTWLRTLEADLQPLNLGLNSAWKYTQNQEHWKHLVETAMLQLGACS